MAVAICTILTSRHSIVPASELTSHLTQTWPSLPEVSESSTGPETTSFKVGVCDVLIAFVDDQLSLAELQGPAEAATLWPEAAADCPKHGSHILVTVSGEVDGVALATLLTQVTGSLLSLHADCLGVIWNSAARLIRSDIFCQFVEEILPHAPPMHLWVDYRLRRDTSGNIAGFTTGMSALGLMEIEAIGFSGSADELMHRMEWLGRGQIEQGLEVSDGDTIGVDESERIRIEFTDSLFGHPGKVMSLRCT